MHTQPTLIIEMSMQVALFDKWKERPSMLIEILTKQQIIEIKTFIYDNLEDKDGAPQMDDLVISSFKYSDEEKSGSFRLHFYINRRFCCTDIESSRQDYIDFHFSHSNSLLQASGIYFNWNVL